MTIHVKFFAKLREDLGIDELLLEISAPATVSDVWSQATHRPLPADIFCAVNHEHASFDQAVKAGDEVAFFPRITGG